MRHRTFVVLIMMFAVPVAFAQMGKSSKKSDMASCQAMMQQHQSMQKQMAEMNAKLQSLVDDMNRSEGAARIDKMAAVINELVAQRAMMQKQMAEMQPEMMHHMMEHMQGGKDSMADCPMMKEQKSSNTPAPHQH